MSPAAISRLEKLEPITLAEMDSVKLLNRTDTKYITTEAGLERLLLAAEDGYRALVTEEGKICTYDTVYYDTPELQMYLDHHNRRLTRKKVRVRTYVGSGETFLEIKLKNNHGRTRKKRTGCTPDNIFGDGRDRFLFEKSGYSPSELSPGVRTAFRRITLVNNDLTERLTIDTALEFENLRNGNVAGLGSAVIIELKQDGRSDDRTKFLLRDLGIKPFKLSKYCIGTAMTSPAFKQNRFKAKIRHIEKITNTQTI